MIYCEGMKNESIRECLDVIFERLNNGEQFSGSDLHRWVVELNDKYRFTYHDTILRVARKYHRKDFRRYKPRESIYIAIKGC